MSREGTKIPNEGEKLAKNGHQASKEREPSPNDGHRVSKERESSPKNGQPPSKEKEPSSKEEPIISREAANSSRAFRLGLFMVGSLVILAIGIFLSFLIARQNWPPQASFADLSREGADGGCQVITNSLGSAAPLRCRAPSQKAEGQFFLAKFARLSGVTSWKGIQTVLSTLSPLASFSAASRAPLP